MLLQKNTLGTVAYMGGVPAVPELFCWSFAQLVQWNAEYLCNPGDIVHYDRAKASYHSYARNTLVERMKGAWLLMLDVDASFGPDLCARLVNIMDSADVDVLTGIYQYKSPPHSPVIYTRAEDGFIPIGNWEKGVRAFEIGSAGAGCLLVKRTVFDRIKDELDESPFDIIPPFSEDHSFFKRLERLGIKAFCAPDIQSYHLVVHEVSLSDYDSEMIGLTERYEVEGRA